MSNRSTAAKKANLTRKFRREFKESYGPYTYDACRMFAKGSNTFDVANYLFSTVESVAALKANFTRGTYSPYTGPGGGLCNF